MGKSRSEWVCPLRRFGGMEKMRDGGERARRLQADTDGPRVSQASSDSAASWQKNAYMLIPKDLDKCVINELL